MTLSTSSNLALAMLVTVAALWMVNVSLRVLGRRLHWVTFWILSLGLPAVALYFLATPTRRESVGSFNDVPREYALAAVALILWAAVIALELMVFLGLKMRDHKRARQGARRRS